MGKKINCLIVAGEKSGEEHCLSFFTQLKTLVPNCSFWGVGGDELKEEGLELIYHLNDFSSWGISEVISKIPFYYKALDKIVENVESRGCRVAILIDFQTFNMKLAKKLKERGVHVLYYVAPQAWVWKEWRTKVLAKTVDTLFTILPFEKKWFNERGVKQVVSVNHPLWSHYKKYFPYLKKNKNLKEGFNLLILPGSRNAETKLLLPTFVEAAIELKKRYNVKISIVCSTSVNENLFEPYLKYFDVVYANDQLVTALKTADLCFAASGTVTLTTALFQVPTLTCYKSSLLNEWIYKTLIRYKWFVGLANIVHNKEVSPELLQDDVSSYNLIVKLEKWIKNPKLYQETLNDLKQTEQLIRGEHQDIPQYISDVLKESYE